MTFTTIIDAHSLRAALDSGIVVLDCRFDLTAPAAGRIAYDAAHIPGARFAHLNDVLAGPVTATSDRHPLPSPSTLAADFAAAGIGAGVQVVVYDEANGAFAARAWWLLRWLGAPRVAVLDGGFNAWTAAGFPVESGEPRAPAQPSRFEPAVRSDAVATSADVLRALHDPQRLLVDARAAERFAGIVETIDPIAGHVPGAVNHPFAQNLGADGRFLPIAELRRQWLERLPGIEPSNVIMMCGSGVTACHNLLALELAGLGGAKLYAGSWSEWIRDPSHQVAQGRD